LSLLLTGLSLPTVYSLYKVF